jgi:heme o synthase
LIKNYFILTKPGIIFGNLIPAIGGFFLASQGKFEWVLFLITISGLGFVIASACVFNNISDKKIDGKMARTRKRPLVTGKISIFNAIIFGSVLLVSGSFLLGFLTNLLTLFVALTGFFFYVVVYGFGKRMTDWGTVIGSISGAIPPVVGYVAVSNNIDTAAILLFLILVFWQMPHFYAIAIYRLKDYQDAGIPVLPIKKGILVTKLHITFYIVGFLFATVLLSILGYTGTISVILISILTLAWLIYTVIGFGVKNNGIWARKMFIFSLIVLLTFSIIISINL